MKHILVVYYSQSGQLTRITDSILKDLVKDSNYQIDYEEIKPVEPYVFPWKKAQFYDVMPESVKGIVCELKPSNIDYSKDYDLVILAYQVWYLSPSIPFWSFLKTKENQSFLKDKKVLTVLGVRNMWVNAYRKVNKELIASGADQVGNVVLADKNNNLLGVILVVRFVLSGKFKPFKYLPRYGVTESDILNARSIGNFIKSSFIENNFSKLQKQIVENKSVFLRFPIRQVELTGSKIFVKWANFILKKGGAGDPKRRLRVLLFKNYLLVLIFTLSPFVILIYTLIGIFFYPFVQKSLRKTALMK